MFEPTKRTLAAVMTAHINRRNHKRKMKRIRRNDNVMLDIINKAYADQMK